MPNAVGAGLYRTDPAARTPPKASTRAQPAATLPLDRPRRRPLGLAPALDSDAATPETSARGGRPAEPRTPTPGAVAMHDDLMSLVAALQEVVDAMDETQAHIKSKFDEVRAENVALKAELAELKALVQPKIVKLEFDLERQERLRRANKVKVPPTIIAWEASPDTFEIAPVLSTGARRSDDRSSLAVRAVQFRDRGLSDQGGQIDQLAGAAIARPQNGPGSSLGRRARRPDRPISPPRGRSGALQKR